MTIDNGKKWLKIFHEIDHRNESHTIEIVRSENIGVVSDTDESEGNFIFQRAEQLTRLRLLTFKQKTYFIKDNDLLEVIRSEKFNPKLNHSIKNDLLEQANYLSDRQFNQFLEAYERSLNIEPKGEDKLPQPAFMGVQEYDQEQKEKENEKGVILELINKLKKANQGKNIIECNRLFDELRCKLLRKGRLSLPKNEFGVLWDILNEEVHTGKAAKILTVFDWISDKEIMNDLIRTYNYVAFPHIEEIPGSTDMEEMFRAIELYRWSDDLTEGKGRVEKSLPPQQTEKPKPELNEFLSSQITHPKSIEIAKAIKGKYSSYKGKDFKILYEALLQLDLFPKKGKRSVFFRCLQNEGYNINNVQMLEDKHFKTGYENRKGNYEKSEDEIQRDTIIEYLKTIIETK